VSVLGKKRFISLPPGRPAHRPSMSLWRAKVPSSSGISVNDWEGEWPLSETSGAISILIAGDFMRQRNTLDQEGAADF